LIGGILLGPAALQAAGTGEAAPELGVLPRAALCFLIACAGFVLARRAR
jgi:hypothetical protein